ncbi:MAG TPA: ComEC/Rec2 family competence protein [Terriglobia bacterium]|nr:ComEC/Rec2 family competence protein [Terriglobia bacterium]
MQSTLLALAGCFALGILLASQGHALHPKSGAADLVAVIPVLLALGGVCMLAGLIALRAKWLRIAGPLALMGFVFAGATGARLFEYRFPPNHVRHLDSWGIDFAPPVRLEGRLLSSPQHSPFGMQFDVDATKLEIPGSAAVPARILSVTGRIRLRMEVPHDSAAEAAAEALELQYGDLIRAPVRLELPKVYRNPGSFDFRKWLSSIEDVYWLGTIKSPLLVEKLTSDGQTRLLSLAVLPRVADRTRARLLATIDRLYPPWLPEGRDGAVLKAILLGDRSSLDSDTIESFRKVGLYHLLVIAGLHVGLLAMLLEILLRQFGLGMTWRSAITLLFLAGFALVVEQRAPTLRATLMIAAYLVARILYRSQPALNAIGLAALVLLLERPAWLLDSGFELSFAAALLIAGLAVPILERTTEPYRRALWQLDAVDLDPSLSPRQAQFRLDLRAMIQFLRSRWAFLEQHPGIARRIVTMGPRLALWTANMVLFSMVLQLGLLLPMAETFHRVSYAGIGLNALAVPVMTVLLAVAMPTVALGSVSVGLARWPARILDVMMKALFALTDLPHLPHWLSYRVPSPPAWVAWAFAISVTLAAGALGRHRRSFWIALAASAAFAALISLHPFRPQLPTGELELTVLDCGDGEASLVVLPDRTTLLVGAGGGRAVPGTWLRGGAPARRRWDPGEDLVSPYLWSRGIERIDVLVAPSTREGRLGGFDAVVANFRIGEFWHGPSSVVRDPSPAYEALLDRMRDRGIPERELAGGEQVRLGNALVQALLPVGTEGQSVDVGMRHRTSKHRAPNEDSLVLRISTGEASVLLAGDLGEQAEQQLASSGALPPSRVLEVSRQSARSSSSAEFVTRIAPQIVIVTADRIDPIRPLAPMIDVLKNAGTQVFRTGQEGAISVKMKGASTTVHRLRP